MMDGGKIADLGAVGNVARVSKQRVRQPQELVSFSVKKGDNGGVLVCENYENRVPEGRRPSSYMGGGDYKENPFSPDDGAAAQSHIAGLLSQMGVASASPEPSAPPRPAGPPPLPPARSVTAARGPNAGAVGVTGPRGSVGAVGGGMFEAPDDEGY